MNDATGSRCRSRSVFWRLAQGCAQSPEPTAVASTPPPAPPDPLVFDTCVPGSCSPNGQAQGQCPPGDLFRVRLVPVAEGLTSPRNLSFMPDGDALVTELPGRVRLIHDGVLSPEPLGGWPVAGLEAGGLQAAIVHPQFATNRSVYLYYVKNDADAKTTLALARARLVGTELARRGGSLRHRRVDPGRAARGPCRVRARRHDLS